jgi:peptidyl-prolyl cis-trans isomerase C
MSVPGRDSTPAYQYHLLRGALERFSKNLGELDERQMIEARRQADKTYDLETLVLASAQAREVAIPPDQVDAAFAEVLSRYPDRSALREDLRCNGLTEDRLRQALHRELLFDGVMQRVSARRLTVSQIDARLYYELHPDKFLVPEQRTARQILITINDDFAENSRPAARARIEKIAEKLRRSPNRFADQARKHSECPSALEGGRLGEVRRGQLYPELDSVLFSMREGAVSDVLETEVGFHLLLCEKITPARSIPFSRAEPRIRALLDERNRRNCQKAFLKRLREKHRETES